MASENIKNVAVVGTGMMGHAIAQEFAQNGYAVQLIGRSQAKLDKAMTQIQNNLIEMVELALLHSDEIDSSLNRIQTTTSLQAGVQEADMIVEAVVEDLEIKMALFRDVEARCPLTCIIASNTSSIMPSLLSQAFEHPQRFLVAHYFNPPFLMPLIEIVPNPKTYHAIIEKIVGLFARMGKKPISCLKEAPGFIANRIQFVIWREAFNIVQKGIATPQEVDMAVKYSFGRRFGVAGPFEIYEHNDGYDLTLLCEKYMLSDMDTSQKHYDLLLEKVSRGEFGAKSGRGFYDWNTPFTEKWRARMFQNLVELRRRDLDNRENDA
ncbi:MAG: 3-hydroxyacyl-CoA dehydrogenase family protein [Deltaproteobacteria bacterium]|nr:3-hydroxyacyl-CoA dehydrogenase family protein [Deltaproteobacteria bacterium]